MEGQEFITANGETSGKDMKSITLKNEETYSIEEICNKLLTDIESVSVEEIEFLQAAMGGGSDKFHGLNTLIYIKTLFKK